MPTARAIYSVVQYVPDGGRAEAANLGVVLHVPSQRWLEIRTSSSLDRVRRFFSPGRTELRRIELAVDALRHRLELARHEFGSETDLANFAASRADAIRLTAPRVVMIENPSMEIVSLFDELVGERGDVSDLRRSREPRLPDTLVATFADLESRGIAWRPGTVRVPTTDIDLEIPVAYANGQDNLLHPESLAPGRKTTPILSKLAFCGQLIKTHTADDRPARLIVVSSDPHADPRAEERFRRTLPEFDAVFVPFRDIEAFVGQVVKTAHR